MVESRVASYALDQSEIKIGRVGHFVRKAHPNAEHECVLAHVLRVDHPLDGHIEVDVLVVNVEGEPVFERWYRVSVRSRYEGTLPHTFHLNRDCPWDR